MGFSRGSARSPISAKAYPVAVYLDAVSIQRVSRLLHGSLVSPIQFPLDGQQQIGLNRICIIVAKRAG